VLVPRSVQKYTFCPPDWSPLIALPLRSAARFYLGGSALCPISSSGMQLSYGVASGPNLAFSLLHTLF
jgi:hypothetical protein